MLGRTSVGGGSVRGGANGCVWGGVSSMVAGRGAGRGVVGTGDQVRGPAAEQGGVAGVEPVAEPAAPQPVRHGPRPTAQGPRPGRLCRPPRERD